jgi:hypothetical protein
MWDHTFAPAMVAKANDRNMGAIFTAARVAIQ